MKITAFILSGFFILSCATINLTGDSRGVMEFKLRNGIRVIFKQAKNGEVVSLRVAFRGGVYFLNEGNAGVEALLMNLSLKGTKAYTKEALNSELFRNGIDIEPVTFADFSIYKVKTLRKYFSKALEITAGIVRSPLFEEKEFEILKHQTLATLRAEVDSPDSLADRLLKDYIFSGHPYFLRDIGRVETVSKIDLEKLKRHHHGMLDASRMFIVVVGDLKYVTLYEGLDRLFGDIPHRRTSFSVVPGFQNMEKPKVIIKSKENVPNTIVEGIFSAPDYTDPDIEPLLIALNILNRKLWNEVRTKKALVYSVYSGLSARNTNYGILYFASRDPGKAFSVIKATVEGMKIKPVSGGELREASELFVTSYFRSNETIASQGGNLAFFELSGGGYERFFSHMERIFSVTPADVQRVMKKYYRGLSFSVVGGTKYLKSSDYVIP